MKRKDKEDEPTKWGEMTGDDLKGALVAVIHGHDPVAARNLIECFHERMRDDQTYDERVLLEYVHHAFTKIVKENWTADQAFGLKLRRGHYERDDHLERDIQATGYVILLMRKGWKWEDAIGEAANLLFPDDEGDKAVEAAYAEYKDTLSHEHDDSLLSMLPTGTPVISRDMAG